MELQLALMERRNTEGMFERRAQMQSRSDTQTRSTKNLNVYFHSIHLNQIPLNKSFENHSAMNLSRISFFQDSPRDQCSGLD